MFHSAVCKLRWPLLVATAMALGLTTAALALSATGTERSTWRYRVVLDEGHSTLDWKVPKGDAAGSHGKTSNKYTLRKGIGVLFVYPGRGKAKSGAGGSDSYLKDSDTYSATACYQGDCEATCINKVDKGPGTGSTGWKIVHRGKAVRITWHVPVAMPLCGDDPFTAPMKPTTVRLALFKRHKLTLRSHGTRTLSQNGAVGTLSWNWRIKLVRKPTR